MNPDRRTALLRNVLQAAETRAAAILKAEQDYGATLRQLLDQAMTPAQAEAVEEATR